MIAKETVIDKIEVLETGHIQVRRATFYIEDGVRGPLAGYHRSAYEPGADVSKEDTKVQTHAAAAWTDDVIAAHKARVEAARAREAQRE